MEETGHHAVDSGSGGCSTFLTLELQRGHVSLKSFPVDGLCQNVRWIGGPQHLVKGEVTLSQTVLYPQVGYC